MATKRKASPRKSTTRRKAPTKAKPKAGSANQLERAKAIIRAQIRAGNQRSTVIQRAVTKAGISVRTYRTARKQMNVIAVRKAGKGKLRGSGTWYTALS